MSRIIIIEGKGVDSVFALQDMLMIGRDPRCQVALESREVSAHHARIIRVGSGFLVEDLQSRNHTYVNGHAVTRARLKTGDRIRIGRTTFRYESHTPLVQPLPVVPDRPTLDTDNHPDIKVLQLPISASETARQKARLTLLLAVSSSLSKGRGLKSTLDDLLKHLLAAFPQAARATVLLSQDSALVPMSSLSREGHLGEQGYSETIARKALSESRALLSIDALSDDRFSESHSIVDLRLRSVMCAPMFFQGKALGVLELDTVSSPQMFGEEELDILKSVAAQVGTSIANTRLIEDYQSLLLTQISTFTLALDSRPVPGHGHGERVSRLAMALGRRLGLGGEALEDLRLGALLHDVGMLSVPEKILLQAEPLNQSAYKVIRCHPMRGVEILEPIKELRQIIPIVRSHHEAYDGTGYPEGLRGSEIPLAARIVAVADAYDAMTQERPYQKAFTPEEALSELQLMTGLRYDPEVMAPMARLVASLSRRQKRRKINHTPPAT